MRKADYFTPTIIAQSSGCNAFQGEDHEEENRIRRQREEQRSYLLQQMEEKKQMKLMEKKQDFLYDQQRLAITRAVDENQQQFAQRNIIMALEMQQVNNVRHEIRKTTLQESKDSELNRDR